MAGSISVELVSYPLATQCYAVGFISHVAYFEIIPEDDRKLSAADDYEYGSTVYVHDAEIGQTLASLSLAQRA